MDYRQYWEDVEPFEEEASIATLASVMDEGRVTAGRLAEMYMDRIARFDKHGPSLGAVLELNPDALYIAEALDVERRQSGARGPLHGIPVLLKDNIDTGDNMHTSAGSLALANSFACKDSFVAERLRHAGAVILGKVNMTEWANFMAENMPNGFSSRGGQVRNPYGPGRFDTGGSSAGSGAAVAANFAAAAIGTETSGSILSPASQNSIVGIKPTVGLVSRSGIIPIAHSQDTAGPMARTVADAAVLLSAISGVDEADAATLTSVGRTSPDYTAFLRQDALRGARIGVPRQWFTDELDDARRGVLRRAIGELRSQGAHVMDVALSVTEGLSDYRVLVYEFKAALNAYLRNLSPDVPVRSLQDLIEFNLRHEAETLQHGQKILLESQATSGTLTEADYIETRLMDLHLSQRQGIDAVMHEHGLNALLFINNFGAGIAAKAGYPSITVPAGYTPEGEPVGITFTASAYSEGTLISYAYGYEQATKHRKAPKL